VSQIVNIPVAGGDNNDYITTKGIVNYTYPSYGKYTVSFKECCRLITGMKVGMGDSYRVFTEVYLDGSDAQSGTLNIPPVLDFGIGSNVFPIFASYPVSKWAFSLSSESLLVQLFSPTTGNYNPRLSQPLDSRLLANITLVLLPGTSLLPVIADCGL